MAHDNYQRVTEGLRVLHESLLGFVQRELKGFYKKDWWEHGVVLRLSPEQMSAIARDISPPRPATIDDLDTTALLQVIEANWNDVFRVRLSRDVRTWLNELRGARNKWAHPKKGDLSTDDAWRALDTMARVLEHLPDPKAMGEVRKLAGAVREAEVKAIMATMPQPAAGPDVQTIPGMAGAQPWRNVATPHPDVAHGRYRQAEFAADLAQVLSGNAEPEYQDPIEFFKRT